MPVDKGTHLQNRESMPLENEKKYQALTRSLTYATMSTRLDIGYITQFLSQSNKNPTQCDWDAVKQVLQYLKGSKQLGIVYRRMLELSEANHNHMTHGVSVTQIMQKTHVIGNPPVGTYSYSWEDPLLGSQKSRHQWPYLPWRLNITHLG